MDHGPEPKANEPASLRDVWEMTGDRNPYLRNIFALLEVDPDQLGNALDHKADRMTRALAAGTVKTRFGRPITLDELTRAKQLSNRAPEYAAERLLAHAIHSLDPAAREAALAEIEAVPIPDPRGLLPLPIRNLAGLVPPPPPPEPSGEATAELPLEEVFRPDPVEERIFDR